MSLPSPFGRSGRAFRFAVAVTLLSVLPTAAFAAPATARVMLVAQDSRDAAQLPLRIQDLEQQVRDLTGQVQGLQFQLTQLQTLIDRNSQDADFRFKALEGAKGGAPGKNDAAGQSGALTPAEVSPQSPGTTRPAGKPVANLAAPQDAPADATQPASDNLGASSDPLVGKGKPGVAPDATVVPLGARPAQAANGAQTTTPAAPRPSQPQDRDPRPGERARVRPSDNARDWSEGQVHFIDAEEIALLHEDPQVGEVAVHFPRLGYDWRRAGP